MARERQLHERRSVWRVDLDMIDSLANQPDQFDLARAVIGDHADHPLVATVCLERRGPPEVGEQDADLLHRRRQLQLELAVQRQPANAVLLDDARRAGA